MLQRSFILLPLFKIQSGRIRVNSQLSYKLSSVYIIQATLYILIVSQWSILVYPSCPPHSPLRQGRMYHIRQGARWPLQLRGHNMSTFLILYKTIHCKVHFGLQMRLMISSTWWWTNDILIMNHTNEVVLLEAVNRIAIKGKGKW